MKNVCRVLSAGTRARVPAKLPGPEELETGSVKLEGKVPKD
jgi:hypothetical protein